MDLVRVVESNIFVCPGRLQNKASEMINLGYFDTVY